MDVWIGGTAGIPGNLGNDDTVFGGLAPGNLGLVWLIMVAYRQSFNTKIYIQNLIWRYSRPRIANGTQKLAALNNQRFFCAQNVNP